LPSASNVTTRWRVANHGIWAFQIREWATDHVGTKRIAGSPAP
jgi:hypothetical protein